MKERQALARKLFEACDGNRSGRDMDDEIRRQYGVGVGGPVWTRLRKEKARRDAQRVKQSVLPFSASKPQAAPAQPQVFGHIATAKEFLQQGCKLVLKPGGSIEITGK